MRGKIMRFSNFSHAVTSTSECFRPDNEQQIAQIFVKLNNNNMALARGNGLSYNDCCINNGGIIIDTSRLNNLLSFDERVHDAVKKQTAVLMAYPGCNVSKAFHQIAKKVDEWPFIRPLNGNTSFFLERLVEITKKPVLSGPQ